MAYLVFHCLMLDMYYHMYDNIFLKFLDEIFSFIFKVIFCENYSHFSQSLHPYHTPQYMYLYPLTILQLNAFVQQGLNDYFHLIGQKYFLVLILLPMNHVHDLLSYVFLLLSYYVLMIHY